MAELKQFYDVILPPTICIFTHLISVPCSQVPHLENGRHSPVKPLYYSGDTISFSCDDDYTLSGGETRLTCQITGEWSSNLSDVACRGKKALFMQ